MRPEARKLLFDIGHAADLIHSFCGSRQFEEYRTDELLKSGVERQLMIAGEAPAQLSRIAPETASQFPDFRQIIAFRNILVHGYATIDDKIVWGILERHLQALRESITTLLKQA